MKKHLLHYVLPLLLTLPALAQTPNTVTATVNGKPFEAKAQRLNLPFTGLKYLALAGMNVNPDVQLWVRFVYTGELTPGTYPVVTEREMENKDYWSKGNVAALVDYTEETKGMGHAFHDGESMAGSVTITKITPTSIEGTFNAKLKGVYYKKRGFATMTGMGLQANLERKVLTKAGGGMLANGGPHDHDNSKKTDQTDDITVTDGKFSVSWEKK